MSKRETLFEIISCLIFHPPVKKIFLIVCFGTCLLGIIIFMHLLGCMIFEIPVSDVPVNETESENGKPSRGATILTSILVIMQLSVLSIFFYLVLKEKISFE